MQRSGGEVLEVENVGGIKRPILDVTKLLRRIQKIKNKRGAVSTVSFKYEYERLPTSGPC